MKLYSTKDPRYMVDIKTAVFHSLPPDNGLYMPCEIPLLEAAFIENIDQYAFRDIAYHVAHAFLQEDVGEKALRTIIDDAVNFPAPVVTVGEDTYVLELFHGPSLAFKDFGARFMSRLMGYFLKDESRGIHILVATSGDTGGAVALGFHRVPGIRVTILYPSGKVSPVQEKQLTTLGDNITALEVNGTFDDCQQMVKAAFLDAELNKRFNLSSANSINISRLIPQAFYYFNAYAQLKRQGHQLPPVFSVPSGNFGNLTAGLIARRMGLPVRHFVAATNINDEVPQYLHTGEFAPKPSRHTLSNAMDVGNPSNFERMLDLFGHDAAAMRQWISGYSFTDEQTVAAIREVYAKHSYIMCPHTAVAYLGLQEWRAADPGGYPGVFLATAHPCKFPEVYDEDMAASISLPPQVQQLSQRSKQSVLISNDFKELKTFLLAEN